MPQDLKIICILNLFHTDKIIVLFNLTVCLVTSHGLSTNIEINSCYKNEYIVSFFSLDLTIIHISYPILPDIIYYLKFTTYYLTIS